jgi:hypothetical protein
MFPVFMDKKSKEFILKYAENDYLLGKIKLKITKLKLKIKILINPV